MKKRLVIFLLFLIFLGSLWVRTVNSDKSPNSLGFDEAGLGYNAYSLLKTGKDEWGYKWPLNLRSFNDYKPALYSYFSIPIMNFFGLSQSSTRAVSAIAGSLSVIFWIFIFKKVTRSNWSVSLMTGGLFSLLPWRIHFSRVALETNLSAACFSLMILGLLNFNNKWGKLLTILGGVLAIYSYHSARMAVPILIALVVLDPLGMGLKKMWAKRSDSARSMLPILAIVLLSLPIFKSGLDVMNRFSATNIFAKLYPYAPTEIVNPEHPFLSLTNNPIYYLTGMLFGRVAAYISPKNILETSYHWVIKSAMVIPDNGMFGYWGVFLFVLGVLPYLSKFKKKKNFRLILYWIVAASLPAAVTWEWYHPFRSLNLFPALEVIAGLGLIFTLDLLRKISNKIFRVVLFTIFTLITTTFLVFNLSNELGYSAWLNNGEFQPGGYKEGAPILKQLIDKYPKVYVDTPHAQSHIFFMFYLPIDPVIMQKVDRDYHLENGMSDRVFNFDKFVYKKFDWPIDKMKNNFIYWTSSEVKENEIIDTHGAKLFKVYDSFGRWTVSIITKD